MFYPAALFALFRDLSFRNSRYASLSIMWMNNKSYRYYDERKQEQNLIIEAEVPMGPSDPVVSPDSCDHILYLPHYPDDGCCRRDRHR